MVTKFCQWSTSDGKNFFPSGATQDKLPPGLYIVCNDPMRGLYFQKEPLGSDDIVRFIDAEADKIVDEMDRFWKVKEKYKKFGLIHKRGVLLYGRQGTGKTYIFRMVMDQVIAMGGICVKFASSSFWLNKGMKEIRQIQPDVPIVAILEDIDSIIEEDCESHLINMLDGVDSVPHSVFLASTNHPENLEGRITNRPSRFDRQLEVGALSDVNRKLYVEHLFKRGGIDMTEVDKVVADTKGMAVDHVKNLIQSAFILDNPYDEALADVRAMTDKLEVQDGKETAGFDGPKALAG